MARWHEGRFMHYGRRVDLSVCAAKFVWFRSLFHSRRPTYAGAHELSTRIGRATNRALPLESARNVTFFVDIATANTQITVCVTGCTPTRDHAKSTQLRIQPNKTAAGPVIARYTGQTFLNVPSTSQHELQIVVCRSPHLPLMRACHSIGSYAPTFVSGQASSAMMTDLLILHLGLSAGGFIAVFALN
eukprot:6191300-Pleurochrysis_carterae.AAC.2